MRNDSQSHGRISVFGFYSTCRIEREIRRIDRCGEKRPNRIKSWINRLLKENFSLKITTFE